VNTNAKIALVAVLSLVACAKLERIDAQPKKLQFNAKDQTNTVLAKGYDKDGKDFEKATFTFASANAAVATVDATGKVTALKSGTTSIEVTSGEKKDVVAVDVSIPAKIVFTSPITITGLAGSAALEAKIVDELDRPIDGGIKFESGDEKIATIADKTVTSTGVGATKIKATFGELSAEADLTVALPAFDAVTAEPAALTVKVGEKGFLTIAVKDAAGAAVAGISPTFKSDNDKVATVEAGQVTGVSAGTANVTVMAGEKSATVKVTVKK
jgi:hypothetical protein